MHEGFSAGERFAAAGLVLAGAVSLALSGGFIAAASWGDCARTPVEPADGGARSALAAVMRDIASEHDSLVGYLHAERDGSDAWEVSVLDPTIEPSAPVRVERVRRDTWFVATVNTRD